MTKVNMPAWTRSKVALSFLTLIQKRRKSATRIWFGLSLKVGIALNVCCWSSLTKSLSASTAATFALVTTLHRDTDKKREDDTDDDDDDDDESQFCRPIWSQSRQQITSWMEIQKSWMLGLKLSRYLSSSFLRAATSSVGSHISEFPDLWKHIALDTLVRGLGACPPS